MRPNVVFLFEILECNPIRHMQSEEDRKKLNRDMMYPVAWAFLRPVGQANIHMSRQRLQLFRYKQKGQNSFKGKLDAKTPEVVAELAWNHKEKYPSFLEIDLTFCNRTDNTIVRKHFSRAPWEREIATQAYHDTDTAKIFEAHAPKETTADDMRKQRTWEKFLDVDSVLPNKLHCKFDTEAQGCYRIKFSPSGRLIAMACTMENPNSKTLIKIADVVSGKLEYVLRGHHDLVHDLSWSASDRYLASASADGSVKIWNLEASDSQADRFEYLENEKTYLKAVLVHPSYVYAAQFEQSSTDYELVVATACFDGKVRLWRCETSRMMGNDVTPDLELPLEAKEERVITRRPENDADILQDEALQLLVDPS